MKRGQASRTAEYVALFRAIESSRGARRLFHDPYAHLFLRPKMRRLLWLTGVPVVGKAILSYSDNTWPGVRSAAVARTCYIDEKLRAALASGIDQCVILGAGYDCRAYRMAELSACRVFEVDHPDTLAHKRDTLLRELSAIPPHVRQVATDFNEQSFAQEMRDAGFDPSRRTFFIWEGVTGYLTAEAVDATLRWIASSAENSELVFTYLHNGLITDPESFGGLRHVRAALKDSNEPWVFGIDPAETPSYLAARGFALLEDLGAREFRVRYLRNWPGALHGYEFYRIAHARVAGAGIGRQV
jgi:methyltransferase (TIGR00027 family)